MSDVACFQWRCFFSKLVRSYLITTGHATSLLLGNRNGCFVISLKTPWRVWTIVWSRLCGCSKYFRRRLVLVSWACAFYLGPRATDATQVENTTARTDFRIHDAVGTRSCQDASVRWASNQAHRLRLQPTMIIKRAQLFKIMYHCVLGLWLFSGCIM